MAAFEGPKDLQPHELSCNCGHCIGLRVSEPFRKELANLRAELSSAKEENVKLKQRIDVAYQAVSGVLTDPDKDINLTRLHDWLGGEDVPAESLVCEAEESEVAKLKKLLAEALPYLEDTCDEGPGYEGWKSDKLCALIQAIDAARSGD